MTNVAMPRKGANFMMIPFLKNWLQENGLWKNGLWINGWWDRLIPALVSVTLENQ
jgi:hypothetical protein